MERIDWRDRISIIGQIVISFWVVLSFSMVCVTVFFIEIPASSQRLGDMLFGGLLTAFMAIVYFWTGSTSGSQKKDMTISDAAKAASTPPKVP